jgi:brefeldin A-resistance guanine nucleotide exchange factor 1
MHALVRTVFSRLHDLDPETEEIKLRAGDEDTQESEIRMTVPTAEPSNIDPESQEVTIELEPDLEDTSVAKTPTTPHVDRPQCTRR